MNIKIKESDQKKLENYFICRWVEYLNVLELSNDCIMKQDLKDEVYNKVKVYIQSLTDKQLKEFLDKANKINTYIKKIK